MMVDEYQTLLLLLPCAQEFSGRALRKLPFLAHASLNSSAGCCSLANFLQALGVAVAAERDDRDCMAAHESLARGTK